MENNGLKELAKMLSDHENRLQHLEKILDAQYESRTIGKNEQLKEVCNHIFTSDGICMYCGELCKCDKCT